MTFAAEVVVVGSGPAGAITAALLAEAGLAVLVLEEGPWIAPEATVPFSAGEMVTKYRNGGATAALGRPTVAYVEGRCVGGGSEVNSGLYHRAPDAILAEWRERCGVVACTPEDLDEHFADVERALRVGITPSGSNRASRKLKDGAEAMGWRAVEVPRWIVTGPDGKDERQTMTRTFVPRLLAAGGTLRASARVERLAPRPGGWALTVASTDPAKAGTTEEIRAPHVFLCAGAIQTPALLRRSGLSRRAGRSLRVHATAKITALFPDVVNAAGEGVPAHQVKEFSPRVGLGCSISQPPHLHLAMLDVAGGHRIVAEDWPRMATYYAMIRSGNGTVQPLPACGDPLVRFAIGPDGHDDLRDGLSRLAECLFAAGATRLFVGASPGAELRPGAADATWHAIAASRPNLMTIHLMGTCPMGEDANTAVADSFGRVHGQRDLHIGDASLLPTAPGVNPQGTIMAFAARNARAFVESRRG